MYSAIIMEKVMSIIEIAEVVVVEAIIADIKNTKSVQKHKNFLHTFCIKENVNIHYIQNL